MIDSIKNKAIRFLGFTWFFLMLIGSVWYFFSSSLDTVDQMLSNDEFFSFNRGSFFLPGIIIGLMLLVFLMIYEGILKIPLKIRLRSLFKKIAIIAILTVFLVPFAANVFFPYYAKNNNYFYCDSASYEYGWAIYKEVFFVKSEDVCSEITKK